MVNTYKFTSDHIQTLFNKIYVYLSFIKLPCTTQNKIQKSESILPKPYLKKLPFFAHVINSI